MKSVKTIKVAPQFLLSQEEKIKLYEGKIARAEAQVRALEQTLRKQQEVARGSKYPSR
jgi:hypothetical protein